MFYYFSNLKNSGRNKKMKAVIYFLFSLLVYRIERSESLSCVTQLSLCSCETNFGNIVLDFSPLDAGGEYKIAFRVPDNSQGITRYIEYNPCSKFACNYGDSAAACISYSSSSEVVIGYQSTARFIGIVGNNSIILRFLSL